MNKLMVKSLLNFKLPKVNRMLHIDLKPRTKSKSFSMFNRMIGHTYTSKKKPRYNSSARKLYNNFFRDTDRDGYPNVIDCQPHNPRRQDVKPNVVQMARIRKMPIYLTHREVKVGMKNTSLVPLEKSGKTELRQRVFSTFKKYPSLYGKIEKEKPRAVIFTSAKGEDYGYAVRTKKSADIEGKTSGKGTIVIRVTETPYVKKSERKYGLSETMETARTTGHELKHINQFKKGSVETTQKKYFKGRYIQQKGEIQARKEEAKLTRSRPDILEKQTTKYEQAGYTKGKEYREAKEFIKQEKRKEERKKQEAFQQLTKED